MLIISWKNAFSRLLGFNHSQWLKCLIEFYMSFLLLWGLLSVFQKIPAFVQQLKRSKNALLTVSMTIRLICSYFFVLQATQSWVSELESTLVVRRILIFIIVFLLLRKKMIEIIHRIFKINSIRNFIMRTLLVWLVEVLIKNTLLRLRVVIFVEPGPIPNVYLFNFLIFAWKLQFWLALVQSLLCHLLEVPVTELLLGLRQSFAELRLNLIYGQFFFILFALKRVVNCLIQVLILARRVVYLLKRSIDNCFILLSS